MWMWLFDHPRWLAASHDRRGRFASLAVAFTCWAERGLCIDDLVGVQWATLTGVLYLGAVVWAFMHERELQRQVEDIRAEREAVNTVQTAPENVRIAATSSGARNRGCGLKRHG